MAAVVTKGPVPTPGTRALPRASAPGTPAVRLVPGAAVENGPGEKRPGMACPPRAAPGAAVVGDVVTVGWAGARAGAAMPGTCALAEPYPPRVPTAVAPGCCPGASVPVTAGVAAGLAAGDAGALAGGVTVGVATAVGGAAGADGGAGVAGPLKRYRLYSFISAIRFAP